MRRQLQNISQLVKRLFLPTSMPAPPIQLSQIDSSQLNEVEDWQKLWQDGIFPWHKESVNPKLEKHWKILMQAAGKEDPSQCRFFVPLCGKSKDMLFLRDQGFQVIGCEGVQQACHDFFTESQIEFELKNQSHFVAKDGKLTIICGDFFKLKPQDLGGQVDCIWDRGSLVAIPVDRRHEYAQVMSSLVNESFGYLLASIERPVDPPGAMPHSLSYDNVKELYGQKHSVHLLEAKADDKNVKDCTFIISAEKVSLGTFF